MLGRRVDIQGLRGWAVAMVVLFHFFPKYFPNGYIGVDVFFVISGFLIAAIISQEKLNSRTIAFFYYRRLLRIRTHFHKELRVYLQAQLPVNLRELPAVLNGLSLPQVDYRLKRIFPLYYLAIVWVLLLLLHFLPHRYQSACKANAWKAITLTSNLKTLADVSDYQEAIMGAENPLTHTWSLGVEVQFYLLLPLFYVLQRIITTQEIAFFAGIGLCSALYCGSINEIARFYSVFARIWQFIAGVLAFVCQKDWVLLEHQGLSRSFREVQEHRRSRYITMLYGALVILVLFLSLLWKEAPQTPLRVCVTLLSAVFLWLGAKYQTVLLSHYIIVYTGDFSYALYLIHWPMQVMVNADVSCSDFVRSVGLMASITVALLTHHIYEKYYLGRPPWMVLLLVLLLMGESVKLYHQLEIPEESLRRHNGSYDSLPVNYSNININDAAWNYTLMRYLNYKELDVEKNMKMTFCERTKDFINVDLQYNGYCHNKNGTGNINILVVGNSYACNQAGVVYKAFDHLFKNFDVFCLPACDMMSRTRIISKHCHFPDFDYSNLLVALKPDVIFILSRVLSAKESFDPKEPLESDKIFNDYMTRMAEMESAAKKVYLLQDLPTYIGYTAPMQIAEGNRTLSEMKGDMIINDDFFARHRIYGVEKRCKKCEVIDYLPMLVHKDGRYYGYNPNNNLLYFDIAHHLNRFAKERIQKLFDRLAKDFEKPVDKAT